MKNKKDIRYKVVKKYSRRSCTIPESLDKYSLIYEKGKVVTAPDNTLGIMTFNNYKNAEKFYNDLACDPVRDYMIIPVSPIGKELKIDKCCAFFYIPTMNKLIESGEIKIGKNGLNISDNAKIKLSKLFTVPYGTRCYKSVKVLG